MKEGTPSYSLGEIKRKISGKNEAIAYGTIDTEMVCCSSSNRHRQQFRGENGLDSSFGLTWTECRYIPHGPTARLTAYPTRKLLWCIRYTTAPYMFCIIISDMVTISHSTGCSSNLLYIITVIRSNACNF